jgi:hypothetical protein
LKLLFGRSELQVGHRATNERGFRPWRFRG